MKFGIGLAPYHRWSDLGAMREVVRAADELGYDTVGLPDHIAIPQGPEKPRSGDVWHEVFVLAAALAAATSTIRFKITALVVPLRHPLHLARLIATLDQVSAGRLSFVAGAGWMESEFDALGIPFHERGPRTDEYLRALKVLWTEDEPSFNGRFVSFPPMVFEPKCVQQPHVPIWIGGTGRAPFRRLIELGDGWAPMVGTFAERAATIKSLRERLAAAGRDPDGIGFSGTLTVGRPDATMRQMSRGHHSRAVDIADNERRVATSADEALDRIAEFAEAGFTHLVVNQPWDTPGELIDKLAWFAENVMRVFHDQHGHRSGDTAALY